MNNLNHNFSDWKFKKVTNSEKSYGYDSGKGKLVRFKLDHLLKKQLNNYIEIYYSTDINTYYISFRGYDMEPMFHAFSEFCRTHIMSWTYDSLEEAKEKLDWFIIKYSNLKSFI